MESNKEYQQRELKSFMNQSHAYFDTVKEFSNSLEEIDILEQIEWIGNGSYGAGACFALQNVLRSLTPRMNKRAAVGRIVLHAFYGTTFNYWNKLSPTAQDKVNQAVDTWLNQEHSFAQVLEV